MDGVTLVIAQNRFVGVVTLSTKRIWSKRELTQKTATLLEKLPMRVFEKGSYSVLMAANVQPDRNGFEFTLRAWANAGQTGRAMPIGIAVTAPMAAGASPLDVPRKDAD